MVLCSLEDALRDHPELVAEHFMQRLTYDRDKLEAAAAAFWTRRRLPPRARRRRGRAPFQIAYVIDEPGTAQYAPHAGRGRASATSALREYDLAPRLRGPGAARRRLRALPRRPARAAASLTSGLGRAARSYDVSTHVVGVARDAHCTGSPSTSAAG